MADTTDSESRGGQHNRGPGVFIAGNVYGDVNNHQTSRPDHGRDHESQASQGHQRNEKERPGGDQSEEVGEAGPGGALLGWTWLAVSLFGMSGYCIGAALLTDRPSTGDRVRSSRWRGLGLERRHGIGLRFRGFDRGLRCGHGQCCRLREETMGAGTARRSPFESSLRGLSCPCRERQRSPGWARHGALRIPGHREKGCRPGPRCSRTCRVRDRQDTLHAGGEP